MTPKLVLGTVIGITASLSPAMTRAQSRIEIRPVETITVSTQQFLLGDKNGRPTTLAGELRIPIGATGRLPAVILAHGSGGLATYSVRWAEELNSIGVAAFLLDSFSGRGIVSTVNDQSQLDTLAMMVDAYRGLGVLARHAQIDARRIAVMGFSKGAVAAIYSSSERFARMWAPAGVQFAAHIGLGTPCYTRYREDDRLTGKPIRLFHGAGDDYVPVSACRSYVGRLRDAGVDAALTEYAGAHHAYDNVGLKNNPAPVNLVDAQTLRNCQLAEGDHGLILNSRTGTPFVMNDQCVERGAHVGYDEAAAVATVKAVKAFLVTVFSLKVSFFRDTR
jgi:dienelactone hydrolase